MSTENTPPADEEHRGHTPPDDDPRVPRPEDAEQTRSKELGGPAPAVGPGSGRRDRKT